MKLFLMLAAIAHMSVYAMENQEENQENSAVSHVQQSMPVFVSIDRLPYFIKFLDSLLIECQDNSLELSCVLVEARDPTLIKSLPELHAFYIKQSGALQQKMNKTLFDGHPFLGTTWQFGRPHLFATPEVVVNAGFRELLEPKQGDEEEVLKKIRCEFNRVVDQVQLLLKNGESKSMFVTFGEAQTIGINVFPGYGISVAWPKHNLPSPSDFSRIQECCNQLEGIRRDISDSICSLAVVRSCCSSFNQSE